MRVYGPDCATAGSSDFLKSCCYCEVARQLLAVDLYWTEMTVVLIWSSNFRQESTFPKMSIYSFKHEDLTSIV